MCPYLVLICGFDGMQGLLAVTNWAAENDEAIVDEPVHECRVPGPAVLVPDLTRGVPAWAVDQPHRKIGHARSVRAIADIHGCPCAAGTPTISTSYAADRGVFLAFHYAGVRTAPGIGRQGWLRTGAPDPVPLGEADQGSVLAFVFE